MKLINKKFKNIFKRKLISKKNSIPLTIPNNNNNNNNINNIIKTNIDISFNDKHYHYIDKYIPNDLYWGIGIENETYFQFDNNIIVSNEFIIIIIVKKDIVLITLKVIKMKY